MIDHPNFVSRREQERETAAPRRVPDRCHICVCVPTYKRPWMLERLLAALENQSTESEFTCSVLVVDNDAEESARDVVARAGRTSQLAVDYRVAPQKNVAVARNVAVENAAGDLIAFIDDDELPGPEWLLNLLRAYRAFEADGVLGPVKPVFEEEPPAWITKARLFERPSYPTGTVLDWRQTRTGNVLLRQSVFANGANRFNPFFKHSEDKDFFRRMTERGFSFVWCDEAPVFETETSDRFRARYLLKRALVRGNAAMRHEQYSAKAVARSAVAAVLYPALLPILLLGGRHVFMLYVIKTCDHVGALMAVAGVDLVSYFGGA